MLLRGKPLGEVGERGQDAADKHRVRCQLCSREYTTTRSAKSQMTGNERSDPMKHPNDLDESQGKELIYTGCLAVSLDLSSPPYISAVSHSLKRGLPREEPGSRDVPQEADGAG